MTIAQDELSRLNKCWQMKYEQPMKLMGIPPFDNNPFDGEYEVTYEMYAFWFYKKDLLAWLIRIGQFLMGLGWAQPTHCIVHFKKLVDDEYTGESITFEITASEVVTSYGEYCIGDLLTMTPDCDFIGVLEQDEVNALIVKMSTVTASTSLEILQYGIWLRWQQLIGNYLLVNSNTFATQKFVKRFIPPVTCTFPLWYPLYYLSEKRNSGTTILSPVCFSPAGCKRDIVG